MRKGSISVLRLASCCVIILIHVLSGSVSFHESVSDVPVSSWIKYINLLLMWAVPVFFMISGYCVSLKDKCTYGYCFGKVRRFALVLVTLGTFYALSELVFSEKTFRIGMIFKALLNVINGNLWSHMWFIYAIIGIYLIMPVIHSFMKRRDSIILLVILFVFSVFVPHINTYLNLTVDFYFPSTSFLFYVCFGSYLANHKPEKNIALRFSVPLIAIPFIGVTVCYLINPSEYKISGYGALSVAMAAMGIFMLISSADITVGKTADMLSGLTWGVYLIHPLFINFALKVLKIDVVGRLPLILIPLFFAAVSALSFGFVYLARKIPYVKSLF